MSDAEAILRKMVAIDAIDIAGGKAWFLVDHGNIEPIDLTEAEIAYLAALSEEPPQ